MEVRLGYPTRVIREGLAEIVVPDFDAYKRPNGVYEPAWAPVFYNPRMAFNRDIAVIFAKAYQEVRGIDKLVVVEPLAGSGVRAIRYALEANAYVYACDIDYDAVELIKLNIERNNVASKVVVERNDANAYMEKLSFEGVKPIIVDIDPFGSPAPFLESALNLLKGRGVIAATATDTAPLSGTHPRALKRRYDVIPSRTAWEKEQATRVLLGYIIRRAATHEYSVKVLLAYYADHYVRVYVELSRGARRADEALKTLAYAYYCPVCQYTDYQQYYMPRRCPYCQAPMLVVGPVYSGELCDVKLLDKMIEKAKEMTWLSDQKRAIKLLSTIREECSIIRPYYRIDRLCSWFRLNMPKIGDIVEAIRTYGYRASRTHFDPRGVKTDAPHNLFVKIVHELALSNTS